VWTALLNQQVFESIPYRKASGQQLAYFAAGDGTDATGRIYSAVKADPTAPTQIAALGTFKETKVQAVRINKYLFFCGHTGAAAKLRRYDPEAGATDTCDGVDTPTYAPVIVRTNRAISDGAASVADIFTEAAEWEEDTISSPTFTITQANFVDVSTSTVTVVGNSIITGGSTGAWVLRGGQVEGLSSIDPYDSALDFVRLDEPGSGFKQGDSFVLTNKTKSKTNNGIGSVTRYATHFKLTIRISWYAAADSVFLGLEAHTAAALSVPLAYVEKEIKSAGAGSIGEHTVFFSLADVLDDSTPERLRIHCYGGAGNHPGTNGPYVTNITLTAVEPDVVFTAVSGSRIEVSAFVPATATAASQPTDVIYLGDQRLSYDIIQGGSVVNLSSYSQIAIPFRALVDVTELRVRLGIREETTDAAAYTDDLQMVTDDDGNTYLVADLSVIAAADRDAAKYLDLYFLTDPKVATGFQNTGQAVFSIGPLLDVGGLSVGFADYEYRVVEKINSTKVASGGGPISEPLTPTRYQAAAQLSLSAVATLPADTDADRIVIYRRGGTFTDGLFRKIAEFSPDSSASGDYWTYTYVASPLAQVFVDRTPDSQLLFGERDSSGIDFYFNDHQPPPTDILAICEFNGRLVAATSDALWVSQLAPFETATGLYWNRVNIVDAPDFEVQGFYNRLSGNDGANAGDSVQRLVSYQDRVVILFTNSVYTFGGNSPRDYWLRRVEQDEGKGLINHRAVCVFAGWLWFLSQDGLRIFTVNDSKRVSRGLDRQLSPKNAFVGSALNSSAYARSTLFSHGDRLYMSVPQPGASTINATWVLDRRPREEGVSQSFGYWTRWLLGEVSGGVVFGSSGDTDDLYLTHAFSSGSTGQMSSIGYAFGDKLLPGDSVTSVPIRVRSREYTQQGRKLHAQRLYAVMESDQLLTATVIAGCESESYTQSHIVQASGETLINRLKIPPRIRGRRLYWELSMSPTTGVPSIKMARVMAVPGRQV
jgi:hypothetical protein